ncbi:MAG: gamma-glutamyltransferase family protein [Candidatus Nanopelagicaceae bacterium]|nr:gamma-glutamyltransferase family protein [Candidatus Nanopelagicaceae bacterium]
MKMHRSNVYCRNGAVAASQPLAVAAGLETLRRGGSAIDAAITVSAVLSVIEPGASHLGGDAFVITHDAGNKRQTAFNGSGEAPRGATADQFKGKIDHHGYRSATVPGLVSTWFEIHSEGGNLPMQEILQPAIEYANSGFPVTSGFVRRIAHHLKQFPETNLFASLNFPTNLGAGDLLVQPELGRSLEAIAADGRDAFYEGEIARSLIESSNGWFNENDLVQHRTRVISPLRISYRGLDIHGQPPPSQGMILMEELLLAEGFSVSELNEAERIHMMVEAKKIAFQDRYEMLGDPEFIDINLEKLFTASSIDSRRAKIDLARANTNPVSYNQEGSDTTYFLTADRDGNAVSWIQSVFHGFGASWVIPGTGIIMNNRLTGFSLDSNSPNYIAPGKRPAHTLNAWIATRSDGSLAHVGGTPGANIQVQTNFQLITNAIDLAMSPQENAEAPRWQHLNGPSYSDGEENFNGVLQIENRVSKNVLDELKRLGHEVQELAPYGHGSSVQLLEATESGSFILGSDPRSEGQAAGF